MNHNFDSSSCTGSRSFKSFKWLLKLEVMSDKRFNIHRSRGNQGQSFGVTTIKKESKKKTLAAVKHAC